MKFYVVVLFIYVFISIDFYGIRKILFYVYNGFNNNKWCYIFYFNKYLFLLFLLIMKVMNFKIGV